MKNRINIFNCPIDTYTMDETVNMIDESIQNKTHLHHVVVNAAKLVHMQKDKELYDSVVNSDIINPDGQAVVWASKFLGQPLKERVAGIDLMENLVKLSHEKGYKVFFFGAKEEIVKGVVDRYTEEYSKDIIAGYRNGYFKKDEEESIANEIASSEADILFVAISSPTKEIFLNKYKDIINTPFIMGVGGSFDVVAGKVTRAPLWMQKAGLEWFYRFLQEPRRMWKRYLVTNSLFIWYMLKEKISIK
ncbi:WecB/TagA/CpsF family glycosyltransferase [Halarcobacter anaerophilus]|uniref:Glycosyltransferase n=1 Tax=Halarcobacter anaerophilus TaxID=877500 RepID=A0A4V1LQH8_9BACT|nr:WecB/TagA/CpsF family glycosyltransferase [Halarcobacter anaerophilus]QDF29509.1 glycosyltransferase [Halarcobacter anaerophilus]RXJ64748.1 glycosyltransferase [Halarcobacter anaerophilus]